MISIAQLNDCYSWPYNLICYVVNDNIYKPHKVFPNGEPKYLNSKVTELCIQMDREKRYSLLIATEIFKFKNSVAAVSKKTKISVTVIRRTLVWIREYFLNHKEYWNDIKEYCSSLKYVPGMSIIDLRDVAHDYKPLCTRLSKAGFNTVSDIINSLEDYTFLKKKGLGISSFIGTVTMLYASTNLKNDTVCKFDIPKYLADYDKGDVSKCNIEKDYILHDMYVRVG